MYDMPVKKNIMDRSGNHINTTSIIGSINNIFETYTKYYSLCWTLKAGHFGLHQGCGLAREIRE